MKYFLRLAYNGGKYHGWQRQEKVVTIQATIEDNLRKIFHPTITIHGCGRTDTGVNAKQYFAHFIVEKEIDFDLVYKLNRMLPNDISIFEVIPVDEKANAQRDATRRTYEYHIHLQKDPFLFDKSACYDMLNLDFDLMKKACQLLTQHKDFTYFCLQPELNPHNLCDLTEAKMELNESQDQIHFIFSSNRFLRGMIRIIVGRLLDVGQQKVSLDDLKKSLMVEQPNKFMKQAYPQGLYLSAVDYPFFEK